ncbi:MAG: LamG-like jellyroll fold domain-containing protein, partial [Polyangiaceae bacterium]
LTTYPAGHSQQNVMLTLAGTGKLSFSLDMKIAASDLTIGQIIALDIDVPDGPGVQDHSFYIESYDGSFQMSESVGTTDGGPTSYTATPLIDVVPNGAWTHLDLTIDGSTGAMELAVDGTPRTVAPAQAGFPAGTVRVNLGGYGERLPNGATSAIDNLIVDP